VSFDNQTVFNDYFQETTFGTTETFKVTLNGPTPLGGSASAFNIAFYASDQTTPLLTVSPDGEAGQIILNGDGSTSVATYPAGSKEPSALTIASATTVVPEPATLGLMGLSMALIGFGICRRQMIQRNAA
jgi:hypothetical protein